MNLRYGPATAQGLQSFLLPMPTDPRLKVRDRFIDTDMMNILRTYTNLMRFCENYHIPKLYGDEAMRQLLKARRGLFSHNLQVKKLIEVISTEPRLQNRILPLSGEIMPRKKPKPYTTKKRRMLLLALAATMEGEKQRAKC